MRTLIGSLNKPLLDEVEHDIMNYQNRGLCYLPRPKAEADDTDTSHFVSQENTTRGLVTRPMICSRYYIYHVKFTMIECSRPIRFFKVSLMYNNLAYQLIYLSLTLYGK